MAYQDLIGGGIVRRTFKMGDERVHAGKALTAAQILAMPISNRRALIEKKFIEVYPPAPQAAGVAAPKGSKRHVVASGFGAYNVIEGLKLNDKPLSKEAAQALAAEGQPAAKAKQPKQKAKTKH